MAKLVIPWCLNRDGWRREKSDQQGTCRCQRAADSWRPLLRPTQLPGRMTPEERFEPTASPWRSPETERRDDPRRWISRTIHRQASKFAQCHTLFGYEEVSKRRGHQRHRSVENAPESARNPLLPPSDRTEGHGHDQKPAERRGPPFFSIGRQSIAAPVSD